MKLKMGDMYSNGVKTVIVIEENDGFDKHLMVLWNKSCYFFNHAKNRDVIHEKEYLEEMEKGKYKKIGNLCDIMEKVQKE